MVSHLPVQERLERSGPLPAGDMSSLPLNLSHMEKLAAIGQLSSSVAHEMRNLLGMIRTAAYNIDRAVGKLDATVGNNLEIINRSVGRAKEFIDNLLNLSRLPRGKEEIADLRQVTDNLLTLFSKEMEWRNIQLVRRYQPLPRFRLDCHAFQECLLNIILNAIQSMEEGGIMTVEAAPFHQGARITVEDTGCGIPPENLDAIFAQFYTTKKNGQGTGLGLTIALRLANYLGGDITVESRLREGSRFSLCLPSLVKCVEVNDTEFITPERLAV